MHTATLFTILLLLTLNGSVFFIIFFYSHTQSSTHIKNPTMLFTKEDPDTMDYWINRYGSLSDNDPGYIPHQYVPKRQAATPQDYANADKNDANSGDNDDGGHDSLGTSIDDTPIYVDQINIKVDGQQIETKNQDAKQKVKTQDSVKVSQSKAQPVKGSITKEVFGNKVPVQVQVQDLGKIPTPKGKKIYQSISTGGIQPELIAKKAEPAKVVQAQDQVKVPSQKAQNIYEPMKETIKKELYGKSVEPVQVQTKESVKVPQQKDKKIYQSISTGGIQPELIAKKLEPVKVVQVQDQVKVPSQKAQNIYEPMKETIKKELYGKLVESVKVPQQKAKKIYESISTGGIQPELIAKKVESAQVIVQDPIRNPPPKVQVQPVKGAVTKDLFGFQLAAPAPVKVEVQAPVTPQVKNNVSPVKSADNKEKNYQKGGLINLLVTYPEIPAQYLNTKPPGGKLYKQMDHGIINEDDYCERVNTYMLMTNTKAIFEQGNYYSDYGDVSMIRKSILPMLGKNAFPGMSFPMYSTDYYARKYRLPLSTNNFFTKRTDFHMFHEIGKHFGCVTQMYNHIPGNGAITRKDLLVETVSNYSQRFIARPYCFKKNSFLPASYRLNNKEECVQFFDIVNTAEHQKISITEPIQYLLKEAVGVHKAEGVNLLDNKLLGDTIKKYQSGALCGEVKDTVLVQKYVSNPLLLDKQNKFDFRVYMLIASTNPLMVYYHDGFLRVSLDQYDESSKEKSTHLTNTFLSVQKIKEANRTGNGTVGTMSEEEAEDYMLWSLDRLQNYLLESKKVFDSNWLDNYLRPAFKKAFIHVARMANESLWKQSNVHEMFGLDFMLDEKMNLWLLEVNGSPQYLEDNGKEFMTKLLMDMFEIEYGLYRSRMKRVLNVIQQLKKEERTKGHVVLGKWKKEYEKALINKFEPEYQISADSSFSLILDESLPGTAGYFGNLLSQCI